MFRIAASLVAFAILASMASLSQSETTHNNGLLARLSYRSTFVEDSAYPAQICFAVYENGVYRLLRAEPVTIFTPGYSQSGPSVFEGRLSKGQLARLRAMLRGLNFRSAGGGLVLEGSESFTAEVRHADKTAHYTWIDADHLHPFPGSVAGLVDWLQRFKAENSNPLTLHELSDVPLCPPMNAKPVQPAIAGLPRRPDQANCGGGRP